MNAEGESFYRVHKESLEVLGFRSQFRRPRDLSFQDFIHWIDVVEMWPLRQQELPSTSKQALCGVREREDLMQLQIPDYRGRCEAETVFHTLITGDISITDKNISPFFCRLVPFLVLNCFQQTGAFKRKETKKEKRLVKDTQSIS